VANTGRAGDGPQCAPASPADRGGQWDLQRRGFSRATRADLTHPSRKPSSDSAQRQGAARRASSAQLYVVQHHHPPMFKLTQPSTLASVEGLVLI
jgi:hypothetical protein